MSTLKKNKQLVFAYNPHNKYGTNKLTSVPNWDKVVKITLILQNINLILETPADNLRINDIKILKDLR